MFTRHSLVAFLASSLAIGVSGVTDARAAPPKTEQEQPTKPRNDKAAKQTKTKQGSSEVAQDLVEWRQAWDQLTPEHRQVLLIAGQLAIKEMKTITDEQRRKLRLGLQALATDTSKDFQDLPKPDRDAVTAALRELRAIYLGLTADQKATMLAEVAGSIVAQAHPEATQPSKPPEPPARAQ